MKKNKAILLVNVLISALALSGCSFLNMLLEELENQIGIEGSGKDFDTINTVIDGKTVIKQTYKSYSENCLYSGLDYCPSTGNVKLLVIPVWFTDSSTYILNKNNVREDIQKAYFGTNNDTGWRSVKTFYEEESFGKISLSGTVSNWYNDSNPSTFYKTDYVNKGEYSSITEQLVIRASDWYFENNPSDSRNNYDSDNNGYLDGVMLIYGAPDYGALEREDYSNLWAYCSWLQLQNTTTKPIANCFFWASYDFMYGRAKAYTRTGTTYSSGQTGGAIHIDTHTFIHEMGHVFGLDEYYDYSYKHVPAGAFSMQDYNVGGHDPFSVMALGWANPYVISDSAEVTIGTFQKTHDFVLLAENFNNYGSAFDEYIILELYSPTGLNEYDANHTYVNGVTGASKVGVRMWHVDARLTYVTYVSGNTPVFNPRQMTTNVFEPKATYGVIPAFSNTYYEKDDKSNAYISVLGESYADYNLLQMIRNSVEDRLDEQLSNSDLFYDCSFDMHSLSDQFIASKSNFKMNNGSFCDWGIKISITGSGSDAKAKISVVK